MPGRSRSRAEDRDGEGREGGASSRPTARLGAGRGRRRGSRGVGGRCQASRPGASRGRTGRCQASRRGESQGRTGRRRGVRLSGSRRQRGRRRPSCRPRSRWSPSWPPGRRASRHHRRRRPSRRPPVTASSPLTPAQPPRHRGPSYQVPRPSGRPYEAPDSGFPVAGAFPRRRPRPATASMSTFSPASGARTAPAPRRGASTRCPPAGRRPSGRGRARSRSASGPARARSVPRRTC
jgi:hypothetical protein